MIHNATCPEHSGIVTWLRGLGAVASLLLLLLVGISTASYLALNEYKLNHAGTTSVMNESLVKVAGSVDILDITITTKLTSIKDDMIDVKLSNQNTMLAVRDLIRSLENQGIIARRPQDSTILLAHDFE